MFTPAALSVLALLPAAAPSTPPSPGAEPRPAAPMTPRVAATGEDPGGAARDELAPALVDRLGSERLRHGDRLVALEHGPGGALLASASANGEVRLWDAAAGAPVAGHDLDSSHALGLGFAGPDRLLLGLRDDNLAVLDLVDGALVRRDPFDVGLGDLASVGGGLEVSPDGRHLVVWPLAGIGGGLILAGLEDGARHALTFEGFKAIGASWSRDGGALALLLTNPLKALGRKDTAGQDSSRILLIDVATGAELATILSPDEYLSALAFGPGAGDEALLVGAGKQGLHLWELGTGREVLRFGDLEDPVLLDLLHGEDGADLVVAADGEGRLEAWQVTADDAPVRLVDRDLDHPLGELELAGDGEHLVLGEGSRAVRLRLPELTADPDLPGHGGTLSALASAGDRVVSTSYDGSVLVWDGDGARRLPKRHVGVVFDADLTADGQRLVTCGQDGTMRVWSLADEDFGAELLLRQSGSTAAFTGARFDPAGERLAGVSADGTLWIWGLEDGLLRRTFEGLRGLEFALVWSTDGGRLAVGSSGARVWDTTSWELVGELADLGSPVQALAFDPRGEALALGLAGRAVQLRRVVDGERLAVWPDLPSRVGDLAWWPGRGLAATARGAGGVLLLGRDGGALDTLASPSGADALVLAVDGAGRLVAGDARGYLQVWE